ncbi:T9SS C-terminal target domain-containing protein [Flavobacterium cupreum]|uniref:T9SS C-terminal target domain-containing protein n=1 Tax=Flavobacterium cupreum TaxID=2133766 RepID=A0A434A8E8_9FLAO|nr:T9SS type A sorting domain-containing protein [Flavobacterium cupreum]RUT70625.1 T9SS C-terminal target domain-containing protein [Flavobacterium cupreum]
MKKTLLLILLPLLNFGQTQIGTDIDGIDANHQFGSSVALSDDGTVMASGGIGHNVVQAYRNIEGTWTKIGANLTSGESSRLSGNSVALSSDGSILAFGDPQNSKIADNAGSVSIFKNVEGVWISIGNIYGESKGDFSGKSVALSDDGSIVAVGAYNKNGAVLKSGQVRVYQNVGGNWTQIGSEINGAASNDEFGKMVVLSADGTTLAIGAPKNDASGEDAGHVKVYHYNSGSWIQIGADLNGEAAGDLSGNNLALSSDGTILAIGAPRNNGNGSDSGHVRVYYNNGGVWKQRGSDINGEEYGDYSGADVALSSDGQTLAIGAIYAYGKNGRSSGHVRIYQNVGGIWKKMGSDIDGETAGDNSGGAVALSSNGKTLAIGAISSTVHGSYTGQVRVYSLATILNTDKFVMENFSLYPNPTSELVNITLNENLELQKVNIYNTLGQLIKTEKSNTISVNALSKGVYYFEIITDKGKATKTVLVN